MPAILLAAAALAIAASAGAAGAQGPDVDVEAPAVVSCPLFLRLTGVNAVRYQEYRFWLGGLHASPGRSVDIDAEMTAVSADCRANPDSTFAEVAFSRSQAKR